MYRVVVLTRNIEKNKIQVVVALIRNSIIIKSNIRCCWCRSHHYKIYKCLLIPPSQHLWHEYMHKRISMPLQICVFVVILLPMGVCVLFVFIFLLMLVIENRIIKILFLYRFFVKLYVSAVKEFHVAHVFFYIFIAYRFYLAC